ncbi:MAG: hypothetical protein AB7O68_16760 [Pirellulales bacterium]
MISEEQKRINEARKRKADREPYGNDRFIRKKWEKKAKARAIGSARLRAEKQNKQARRAAKRARIRAALAPRGGPLRDGDEDFRFEDRWDREER